MTDGIRAADSGPKGPLPVGSVSGPANLAALLASVVVVGVWLGEGGDHRRSVAVSLFIAGSIVWVELRTGRPRGNERVSIPWSESRVLWRSLILSGIVLAGLVGMARSSAEWRAADAVRLGPYRGEADVIGDSKEVGKGRRMVLEIDGQRFESWLFGSKRHRARLLESGDVIAVDGVRREFSGDQVRRSQIRHVLGRFEMTSMTSLIDGHRRSAPIVRAANRVRGMIRKGADLLDAEQSPLFTGLVYGDDSSQPPEMVADFRASGLAHLTAVSGQNVVFVLAAAGPLLARLRRTWRIGCTLVLLVWFAIMTRLEPSVIRAVFMAGTSALMAGVGGPVSSWVALSVTVAVASLIDPFLVWSVGWWLSVAGCAGLIVGTPAIGRVLRRFPAWMSSWISPTIAAQTGVLGVIVGVFGWPSAMSIPCNLLAAPVAGLVMLIGLPLAIVAGMLPAGFGRVVMWPIGWGVEWVESVAALGARIDPPSAVDATASLALAIFTAWAIARFRHSREEFVVGVPPARPPL